MSRHLTLTVAAQQIEDGLQMMATARAEYAAAFDEARREVYVERGLDRVDVLQDACGLHQLDLVVACRVRTLGLGGVLDARVQAAAEPVGPEWVERLTRKLEEIVPAGA